MQSPHIKNILLLLSRCPVQISRPRRPYPRHWKLNQRSPLQPLTLGEQIKMHRLELHWLQSDVAAKIGTSSASISNWERGIKPPSRRMKRKIQEFLGYTPPARVPKEQGPRQCCWTCGISETSPERCLFERICK
jgi:DNA-binding XRE family transcriptional regulator